MKHVTNRSKMELKLSHEKENRNKTTRTKNLDIIDNMAHDFLNNSLSRGIFQNRKIQKIFTQNYRRSLKTPSLVTRDTIVYMLPGTGERSKNYDKIATDIKKMEKSIRKENELKLKNKNDKSSSGPDYFFTESRLFEVDFDIDNEEDEKVKKKLFHTEEYNILEVIQKFKIPPEKRTIRDLYVTKNYLYQTKLTENYINEFNDDKKIIENIITFAFGIVVLILAFGDNK